MCPTGYIHRTHIWFRRYALQMLSLNSHCSMLTEWIGSFYSTSEILYKPFEVLTLLTIHTEFQLKSMYNSPSAGLILFLIVISSRIHQGTEEETDISTSTVAELVYSQFIHKGDDLAVLAVYIPEPVTVLATEESSWEIRVMFSALYIVAIRCDGSGCRILSLRQTALNVCDDPCLIRGKIKELSLDTSRARSENERQ